jgi:hypothetical protein
MAESLIAPGDGFCGYARYSAVVLPLAINIGVDHITR